MFLLLQNYKKKSKMLKCSIALLLESILLTICKLHISSPLSIYSSLFIIHYFGVPARANASKLTA